MMIASSRAAPFARLHTGPGQGGAPHRLAPAAAAGRGKRPARRRGAKAVWPLIEAGKFKPVIDSTYPLTEVSRAHAHMEKGVHIGKILLTM